MFTRRDFLKGSIIVGTIPALGFVPRNVVSDDFGDTVTYKNYQPHWSGYVLDATSMKMYGTWTARLIEHYIFYASNVGLEGIVFEGSQILLSCLKNQVFPHMENFMADKDLAKNQKVDALNRIKNVIDLWLRLEDIDAVNKLTMNRKVEW